MTSGTSSEPLRARNEARCQRILEKSELLEVDDLGWQGVGARALDPGVVESLVYMRDVEGFTPSYLSGLGAHRTTLADPLVRAFFEVWQAEEAEHSRAIHRYLTTYGTATGTPIPAQPDAPASDERWYEHALGHLGGPFGALVATAHMTWGAANELLTMNGYRLLADQCDEPVLAELLRRIANQEARHYSFYLLQAEWRLASSRLARIVLPRVLDGAWTPVGIGDGYKTAAEFRQVLEVLTARPESERVVARMDRRFSALPGFERLRIYRDAMSVGLPAT
jgi:rubrerythrin